MNLITKKQYDAAVRRRSKADRIIGKYAKQVVSDFKALFPYDFEKLSPKSRERRTTSNNQSKI